MTPTKTECTTNRYAFGKLERRQVVADFSGPEITSDGGLILVAQLDQRYRISERLAACFTDQREPSRVQHPVKDLIAQRLSGLVQGYEDRGRPLVSCGMTGCLGLWWGNWRVSILAVRR